MASWTRTYALDKTGPDFWSLGVQSDGHWSVVSRSWHKALSCFTDVLDGLSMVLLGIEKKQNGIISLKNSQQKPLLIYRGK